MQRYYVWGNYIDELLMFRDVIGTGGSANADYFATRHHNYNIVALLDDAGAVVERYDYNPYGQRFVLDTDYTADANGISDFGLTIGHQGLMHDEESGSGGLVQNRYRMLHTGIGRFMQRDPLNKDEVGGGYQDGLNLQEYVASNPVKMRDPSGQLLPVVVIGIKVALVGSGFSFAGYYFYCTGDYARRCFDCNDAYRQRLDRVSAMMVISGPGEVGDLAELENWLRKNYPCGELCAKAGYSAVKFALSAAGTGAVKKGLYRRWSVVVE